MNKELLEIFILDMNLKHLNKFEEKNGYILKDKNDDEIFIYSDKYNINIVHTKFKEGKKSFLYNPIFKTWVIFRR